MTIDSKVRDITVEVTDDLDGHLVAKVTGGDVEDLTFVNTYKAEPTKAHFEGIKTLNGRELKDAEFSFTLADAEGEVIETVQNDGDGKIVFTDITYDKVGTYTYTVKEEATTAGGVTIDSRVRDITVEVTDDLEGHLVAKVTGGTVEDLTFVNTYKAEPTKAHFEGIKTLNGRALKDAEFSFTLYDAEGEVIETVKNDGEGKIVFSDITYDKVGTYTYEVKEEATDEEGVTIDSTVRAITVEVTDDLEGHLVAKVTGAEVEDLTFVNNYKPGSTSVTMGGRKVFEGYPEGAEAPEFTYTLSENGEVIDTQTTKGAGSYRFKSITYTEAGTHVYTVKEVEGKVPGVTYDKTVYTVTVTVTDDGNGHLKAEATGADIDALDFDNPYKPEPTSLHFSGVKTLHGKKLKDAEFRFTLTGSDGTKETVTNDGNGKISFSEITYTKAGTYTYQVKEEATSEAGITIDKTVYNITVKVTDDGSGKLKASVTGADINALNFTNKYGNVKTGDDGQPALWIMLMAASAAAIFEALRRRIA